MDHQTYLDRYSAITAPALDELALMLARMDGDDATDAAIYLSNLRASLDALWEQFRAEASQQVKP